MKQVTYRVLENTPLAPGVFRMALAGDTGAITAPGQFINIRLDGLFLRRPISVCDWDDEGLTLIYKVVGRGTAQMAEMRPGEQLDCLSGLGNGYDVDACPDDPVLVGGGVGVPPLYGLAKRLLAAGRRPRVILGFNRADEIFFQKEFEALGVPVTVCTADGSAGTKGFVTAALRKGAYVCACGPEPMLKAVHSAADGGQFSFEARMGCGFGACMGCTCQTLSGPKRICREGPVMQYGEILWKQDGSDMNQEWGMRNEE